MQRFLFAIAFLVANLSFAQQFQIEQTYTDAGKVYINFRIKENFTYEKYKVDLYSSHNNFSEPVKYVRGPITQDAMSATGEVIQVVWDAQRELKEFDGNIQLELRGRVIYTPVHSTKDNISAKQTKITTLEWEGGNPSDDIKIELVKNGSVIETLANVQNVGYYDWNVTKAIEKGDGYKIRYVNLGNPGESYETNPFKIGSKIGLALKLAPIAVLGGAAAVFLLGGDDGGGDEGGGSELPDPPGPTRN